ncbi:MAG: GC-type dockerin domain-anchored protein [Phycisphaerales bacterium JB059]
MIDVGLVSALLAAPPPPASPQVLFVRGADRSGGFFEAENDADRTEQLADIDNTSTAPGNHGWFELAEELRNIGFDVSQIIEPLEDHPPATGLTRGDHIDFEAMDLSHYDVIVMGSNNAVYDTEAIDAFEAYIRAGGAALFISDAGFGSNWADASDSDQQFLDRFGWTIQQDLGVYAVSRDEGDFLEPGHPVLRGVDVFEGEGVSPGIGVSPDTDGMTTFPLVRATPDGITRDNDGIPGTVRAVRPTDSALIVGEAGCGRLAVHFDRNTFFNLNGAGTDLNKLDHRQYALNLFRWLADPGADRDRDGILSFDDILHYLNAFAHLDPSADLAPPFAHHDLSDLLAFLRLFNRHCVR